MLNGSKANQSVSKRLFVGMYSRGKLKDWERSYQGNLGTFSVLIKHPLEYTHPDFSVYFPPFPPLPFYSFPCSSSLVKISLSPEVSAEFKGVSEHTGYSPADHLDKQPLSSVISLWGPAEFTRLLCTKNRRERQPGVMV